MIVLKILLWIVLAILGIILLFLIIPIGAEIAYIDKKFTYKIIYGFVNLHDSENKGIASKFIDRFINKRKNKDIEDDIDDNIEEVLMSEPDEVYDNDDDETDDMIEDTDEETEVTETESVEEISDDTETDSEESDESEEPEEPKKEDDSGKIEKLLDKLDKYEEKIEILLDMLRSADRPLIHLCKGFKFSRIYIDFMIADEDAYKCALNYGRISGAIYNLLGWLCAVCTTRFETVDIFPDFKAKESRWDISVRFSFKFITPIVAGIYFLITYMFRFFIPQKWQERKLKKSRKSKK